MNDIKSVRNDDYYSSIKSVPKQMFIPKNEVTSPMIYYNSLSTERMVENGKTKYKRVEKVYDGKKGQGRVVVDINDKHIEKDFYIKDLEMFMNQSSSSIEDLQKKYGITKKSNKTNKSKKKTNKSKKTKK